MCSRLFLFCFLIFSTQIVSSQQVRSQAAFLLLQTAQTLMQNQYLDAAEQFFLKGLEKAKAKRDKYAEAYACQGLGMLFSKFMQHQKSEYYYRKAARLYNLLKLPALAKVVEDMLKSMQNTVEQLGSLGSNIPSEAYGSVR